AMSCLTSMTWPLTGAKACIFDGNITDAADPARDPHGSDSIAAPESRPMTETTPDQPSLTEARATAIVWKAVEQAGGTRAIYRNPRMAYAFNARREIDIDGHLVDIRYGE